MKFEEFKNRQLSFAFQHEKAGKPRAFTVEYLGFARNTSSQSTLYQVVSNALSDVITSIDARGVDFKCLVTSKTAEQALASPIHNRFSKKLLTSFEQAGGQNPFVWLHKNEHLVIKNNKVYTELKTIRGNNGEWSLVQPTYTEGTINPLSHACTMLDDGVVEMNLDFMDKFKFDKPELKAYSFRAFKENKGKMTFLNFIRWYVFFLTGKDIKEEHKKLIQNTLKDTDYYLYCTYTDFERVCEYVYDRTNTRSCMRDKIHRLPSFRDNSWRVREPKTDKVKFFSPFNCYDNGENMLLLLSTVSPDKLNRKIFDKFPFVARAFTEDTSYYTRAYGLDNANSIFESFSITKILNASVTHLRAYYNHYDELICPYTDGRQWFYSDRVEHTDENGLRYIKLVVCDESDTSYHEHSFEIDSSGILRNFTKQRECYITGNLYDEDEMYYVEDIGEWVYNDFARLDKGLGYFVLDGAEVLRYFR